MIQIIDNAIPLSMQNHIEHQFMSSSFPWFFIHGIAGGNTFGAVDDVDGWAHIVRKNGQAISQLDDLLTSALYVAAEKANIRVDFVERIRAGLFTPVGKELIHASHVDYEYPHLAMLYYVVDSDGPTVFYNPDGTIMDAVDPKKGRAVIFDGLIRHASSSPVESRRRIVINYNFNTPQADGNRSNS
jgi:hypothetical protein